MRLSSKSAYLPAKDAEFPFVAIPALQPLLNRWLRNEAGSVAVEYSIVAGGIFLAIVTTIWGLSDTVGQMFSSVASALANM